MTTAAHATETASTYVTVDRRLTELRDTLAVLLGTSIPMAACYAVLDAVAAERTRQHAKHGTNTPDSPTLSNQDKFVVLAEEVGEVARALTYDHDDPGALQAELVQVAAVALGWLDHLAHFGEKREEPPL